MIRAVLNDVTLVLSGEPNSDCLAGNLHSIGYDGGGAAGAFSESLSVCKGHVTGIPLANGDGFRRNSLLRVKNLNFVEEIQLLPTEPRAGHIPESAIK